MHYTSLLIAILAALGAALAAGQILAHCGFPIPDAARRIGCVDGLRGYLALLVMMHHFDLWTNMSVYGMGWGNSSSRLLRNFGPGGVTLFFMATGLVFYPRIERGLRAVDWRATYLSRVFRILPLQAVMIGVAVVISLAMGPTTEIGSIHTNAIALLNWITSHSEPPLFGYQDAGAINAHVLWSLRYEWLFYLFVLPILAGLHDLLGSRLHPLAIPVGAVVLGAGLGLFVLSFTAVIFFLPLFAFGMIAYVARRYPRVRQWLSGPLAAVIAVIALAVVMNWGGIPFELPQLAGYALFFCCIAAGNSFAGLFSVRGSVVLGEISFGIYLIHGTVLYLLFTFFVQPGIPLPLLYALLPVSAVVAVLVSAAAHLVIERPGIALGRRLSGKPKRPFSPAIERETANLAP